MPSNPTLRLTSGTFIRVIVIAISDQIIKIFDQEFKYSLSGVLPLVLILVSDPFRRFFNLFL
jgi:hypothetical protein